MVSNEITHRILRCLNKSNNQQYSYGKEWYKKAHATCKEISGEVEQPLGVVVKTLALLSPCNKWERNIEDTRNILRAYKDNQCLEEVKVCTFKPNKDKVIDLLTTGNDSLKGRKVTSFFDNIMYPESSRKVTIDRWIMRIVQDEDKTPNTKEYDLIESKFQHIGDCTGLKPFEVQAICWSVIRGSH